jgi:hypothetical protein
VVVTGTRPTPVVNRGDAQSPPPDDGLALGPAL